MTALGEKQWKEMIRGQARAVSSLPILPSSGLSFLGTALPQLMPEMHVDHGSRALRFSWPLLGSMWMASECKLSKVQTASLRDAKARAHRHQALQASLCGRNCWGKTAHTICMGFEATTTVLRLGWTSEKMEVCPTSVSGYGTISVGHLRRTVYLLQWQRLQTGPAYC